MTPRGGKGAVTHVGGSAQGEAMITHGMEASQGAERRRWSKIMRDSKGTPPVPAAL